MLVGVGTAIGVRVTILCVVIIITLPLIILLRAMDAIEADKTQRMEDQRMAIVIAAEQMQEQLQIAVEQMQDTKAWIENQLSANSFTAALDVMSQTEEFVFPRLGVSVLYSSGLDALGFQAFSPTASSPTLLGLTSALRQPPVDGSLIKANNTAAGSRTSYQVWATNSSSDYGTTVDPSTLPQARTIPSNCGQTAAIAGSSSTTLYSQVALQMGSSLQDTWRSIQWCSGFTVGASGGSLPAAVTAQVRSDTLALSTTLAGGLYDSDVGWFAVVDLATQTVVSYWSPTSEATTDTCLAAATTTTAAEACVPTAMADIPNLASYAVPYVSAMQTTTTDTILFRQEVEDSDGAPFMTVIAKHLTVTVAGGSGSMSADLSTANTGGVTYTFISGDATIRKRTFLMISLGVPAACLLVFLASLLVGLLTKLYFLDDFSSLQTAMEGVMMLDFDACDGQRRRKGLFTEINSLRAGFVRTAETIQGIMRYIPKEVVKDMLSAGNLNSREMVSKKITVIFLDIFDFSKLCESLNSDDLVQLAERYFSLATKILTQHGCTIDKFIGDVVMGFWGAPLEYFWQGYSALTAALHLLSTSKRLSADFDKFNHKLILRMGITRGQCAVGNIGSDERVSYTALGDSVNLASRLQLLNSYYKCQVICSEEVLQDANGTTAMVSAAAAAKLGGEVLGDADDEGQSQGTQDQGTTRNVMLATEECPQIFASRRLGLVRVKGKAAPTAVFHVAGVHKKIVPRINKLSEQETADRAEYKKTAAAQLPAANYSVGQRGSQYNSQTEVLSFGSRGAGSSAIEDTNQVQKFSDEAFSSANASNPGSGLTIGETATQISQRSRQRPGGRSIHSGPSSGNGPGGAASVGGMHNQKPLEKVTVLNLADEVNALKSSVGKPGTGGNNDRNNFTEGDGTKLITKDQAEVLSQLTKAMTHFEEMRFSDAVTCYEILLQESSDVLTNLGLNIPTLAEQRDYWQLLVAHTPPRDSFDPCENMTTK